MRRRRKVALGLLAGAAMAGAVGWILLARGAGMGALVPAALRRAAPQGWRIEVASVEGDWRSRLRLRDLVMTGPSGTVSVRELLIHYRLSPLLGRRIEIPRIEVIEPRAHLRADTTAAPEEPSDSARSPALDLLTGASPLGAWSLELGELRVSRAAATLEGTRGAYEVEDAGLLASARLDSGTVMLAVDSLVALLEPPDGDAGTGELRFAGMLRNGVARVRELELRSSRSRVHGEGQVALARPATAADSAAAARVEALGFTLRAAPLDLRDLPLELPGPVLADPLVTLSVDASGGSDSAQVHAVSEGPASVRADLTAVLRLAAPGASGGASPAADVAAEPELTLHGQAAADLAAWAPPPLNGALTLEVDAEVERLDGSGAARARGTLLHRPGAEAPEGVLGRPLRVRVEAERASSADDADRSLDALVLLGSLRAGSWEELGAVRASAAGTRADWSADLALDTGSLSGRGSVAWGEGAARVVVDALALRDLDVAALDASLPPSDLTGRLVASVAGAALDDLAGEVALAAAPSTFGETRLDTLALTATLRPGTVEGALLAALPGARLTSSVDVRLTDSLVEASLPDLHLVVPVADSAVAARAAAGAASADSAAPDAATTDRAAADSLAADTAAAEARARVVATWALGAARRRGTLLAELDSASV
ncbi:MAG TPA: hypothetical protein VFQ22_11140, partial [Longimicrobiales bacterium]|nr:hypothetical protein [Longimicrobiales bacterium]